MLFSDLHHITRTAGDDWFDPILDHDTKLFIDPFLIFRKGQGDFASAHNDLVAFFQLAFEIAASTGGRPDSVTYRQLLQMLLFPEVDGLRLGFAKEGHGGAGTAAGFAKEFAGAIMATIAFGLKKFEHFEEIGIFNEGIGRDRISDITANVLLPQLIRYTQRICAKHNVPTQRCAVRSGFNLRRRMWEDDLVDLPLNPSTSDPVLLVPKAFLRTDPTLQKEGFREYLWDRKNEELRTDFNYAIKSDLDQKAIVDLARRHPNWVEEYVAFAETEAEAIEYDLERDPDGLYKWHRITEQFVQRTPLAVSVQSDAEFLTFVAEVGRRFKLFVEKKGGWKLIWDRDLPLSEEGIQNYFYGIAYHYCAANDILMQREVETGRGPVDFYFSSGFRRRALIEAKLARNGHFWNNLANQLPEYMTAEEIVQGHYMIVCYRDHDVRKKVPRIRRILDAAQDRTGYRIGHIVIDARPNKPSASKVR